MLPYCLTSLTVNNEATGQTNIMPNAKGVMQNELLDTTDRQCWLARLIGLTVISEIPRICLEGQINGSTLNADFTFSYLHRQQKDCQGSRIKPSPSM